MATEKTKKSKTLDKYSALLNKGLMEYKIRLYKDTSIKDNYSNLVAKDPVLISRELVVNGHVMLGVEYDTNGEAIRAYTTDKTGKHITIDKIENNISYEDFELKDMIAEHFAKLQETSKAKETKAKEVTHPASKAKEVKHPASKVLSGRNSRSA